MATLPHNTNRERIELIHARTIDILEMQGYSRTDEIDVLPKTIGEAATNSAIAEIYNRAKNIADESVTSLIKDHGFMLGWTMFAMTDWHTLVPDLNKKVVDWIHGEKVEAGNAVAHHFIVMPDPDGEGYFVFFPDLPGCMTQGESLVDAMLMAADAYRGWTDAVLESKVGVPADTVPAQYEAYMDGVETDMT